MADITTTNLEAALLDQKIAGAFAGKRYAIVSVVDRGDGYQIGVAVANEDGYHPVSKFFRSREEADRFADGLNDHIGLTRLEAARIVASTMGGKSV